ncbi:hypothetical protein [Chryseolinea sp. H1M3-3]|uniref:hypothetical protein n=1 Tax=Chryseolinea sp. H1M3-3 TaxID=3034144 RepID=UPI0023EB93A0|nr:hypothetical protein [Chryseolinea sp. H1M3-3]
MKRFSISRLEEARRNPAEFGKLLNSETKNGGMSFSKYMAWQHTLFRFHKTKDLPETINYFESLFWGKFVDNRANRNQYEKFLESLNAYIKDHDKNKYKYIDGRVKMDIKLSEKVKITGQIPIVNMSPVGYSVFFLVRGRDDWEEELKFPVVQNYLSESFGVKLSEVEVGVYDLEKEKHICKIYSARDVREANVELIKIGRIISSNLI